MSGLKRGSAFSYECHGCCRCCYNKKIQINPYEAAVIADALSVSTTEFLSNYCDYTNVYLKTLDSGACIFLDPKNGCSVHQSRPLVCRLYPLGRVLNAQGEEYFIEHPPSPHTEGIYKQDGTISDWITDQDANQHIEMGEAYYKLFLTLGEKLKQLDKDSSDTNEVITFSLDQYWLDMDKTISQYCMERKLKEPQSLTERAKLHIHIILVELTEIN